MKRHVYVILFLLAAFMAIIGSGVTSGPQTVTESLATIPAHQQISYVVSHSDCAIPVQIAKIQVIVNYLSTRQQLKRLSLSVFGLPANMATSCSVGRSVYKSLMLFRSLETYDIGFPFSSFW